MTFASDFCEDRLVAGTYRAFDVAMDRSTLRHVPTDERQTHTIRTVLTVVLTRIQIAQRHLDRGNYAEAERQLAEVEDYIRQTADAPEIASLPVTKREPP
jgi:hypothetical protein